jgi:hypothetical protein
MTQKKTQINQIFIFPHHLLPFPRESAGNNLRHLREILF